MAGTPMMKTLYSFVFLLGNIQKCVEQKTPGKMRPEQPPPRTDMQQGNHPVSAGFLLSFVLYWISTCIDFLQTY